MMAEKGDEMNLLQSLQRALAGHDLSDNGVTVADVLSLPDPLNKTVKRLLRRRKMTLPTLAKELNVTLEEMKMICHFLVEKGFFEKDTNRKGETVYRVRLAPKPKSTLPNNLLQALDDW